MTQTDYAQDDFVLPFTVEGADVRGRIARLGPLVDQVLCAHAYPEAVSRLLGEALTLVSLLGSALKFEGIFSLQTKGDGPVSILVADYVAAGSDKPGILRGYAAFSKGATLPEGDEGFAQLVGNGHFALTIDPGNGGERYQGIVPLTGASLAECAQNYFRTSEQIPTAIALSVSRLFERPADRNAPDATQTRWRAGGMLIQHMPKGGQAPGAPEEPAEESDAWRRCKLLMGTLRDDELTDPHVSAPTLLYRLFHEDGVRVYPGQPVVFGCRCSRERLEQVLRQYSRDDLEELLQDGHIRGNCEFCNRSYNFTLDELAPENPCT